MIHTGIYTEIDFMKIPLLNDAWVFLGYICTSLRYDVPAFHVLLEIVRWVHFVIILT